MSDVVEYFIPTTTCVVAFASGGGDFSGELPHFEFGRHLQSLRLAHVLLRDSTGFSYQYGIHGIGDREAVIKYLVNLPLTYSRVVLMGLSVGALAALMYGELVWWLDEYMEIIALSPYTSLGNDPAVVFGPDWLGRSPWPNNPVQVPLMIDLHRLYGGDHRHTGRPSLKTRAFISDGEGTEQDRWHAERIGVTDITLVPGASHAGLGKLMRDNGMLAKLLLDEEGAG